MTNIYIFYQVNLWSYIQSAGFSLENSLFGYVKLTINADTDQYPFSKYSIGFHAWKRFSFSDGSGFGKNVIVSGADKFISSCW